MILFLNVKRSTTFAHMLKKRTRNPYRHASSKRAAALGGRELTLFLLKLLVRHGPIPEEIFDTAKQKSRKLWEMRRLEYLSENNIVIRDGLYLLSEEKIWSLTIPRPKQWDGKWRMVLFDIPAKKAKQRNSFRARLKELGLILYQNSVWVYPYPLEKTIRMISDFYMISDCVLFAVAEKLNNGENLARRFGLKK